jgi:hypothetical protein
MKIFNYINSNIEINCSQSFSLLTKWTILHHSNETEFDSKLIETTSNELYIPSQTLSYGLYELKLTVILSYNSSNLTKSKSVFIQINPSGI